MIFKEDPLKHIFSMETFLVSINPEKSPSSNPVVNETYSDILQRLENMEMMMRNFMGKISSEGAKTTFTENNRRLQENNDRLSVMNKNLRDQNAEKIEAIRKLKKENKDLIKRLTETKGQIAHQTASKSSRCYDGRLNNLLKDRIMHFDFYAPSLLNIDSENYTSERISEASKIIFKWWEKEEFSKFVFDSLKTIVENNLYNIGIFPSGPEFDKYLESLVAFNLERDNTIPYMELYYPDVSNGDVFFDEKKHILSYDQIRVIDTSETWVVKYVLYPGLRNTFDDVYLHKATVVV
jgi:hypothetical protein